MLSARVSVPVASMRILDGTPYQLLPAPPVGYAYDVFDVIVLAENAAVPFAAGGAQFVGYTATPGTYKLGSIDLSVLAGGNHWMTNMAGIGSLVASWDYSHALNQPVYLGGGAANLTGGDAPAIVTIFYTLVAIP